jgi:hypothetical protein
MKAAVVLVVEDHAITRGPVTRTQSAEGMTAAPRFEDVIFKPIARDLAVRRRAARSPRDQPSGQVMRRVRLVGQRAR